jgi:hypothetical protein
METSNEDMDFLPLLAENIKQELYENPEKSGNLCDSVDNKVGHRLSTINLRYLIN